METEYCPICFSDMEVVERIPMVSYPKGKAYVTATRIVYKCPICGRHTRRIQKYGKQKESK